VTGDGRPSKARIFRLKDTPARQANQPPLVTTEGEPIHVQFNPTSMRIQRNNDTSGGATTRAQRRQQPNEGHATLSLDLEFDTAEGGPGGSPLDVRSLTGELRQFAEPPDGKAKKAPPRMRFEWGTFHFDGIVSSLTEEIDYFSPDGMPLRAKVSLSITGQDAKFEANQTGQGARRDGSQGSGGAGPGGQPTTNPDRAAAAQDGESVQQALSRLGLDPAAWRSAMAGLDSPLGLTAGAQLAVDASASVSAGLGATAGFGAGAALSAGAGVSASAQLDARVAAAATATGSVSVSAQADAGFALSAAGGVAATARGIAVAEAQAGVATARASFAVPAPATPPGVLSAHASASASAEVDLDVRASTYARGVPLKPPVSLRVYHE
jgi:hypothetical protein